MSYRRVIEEWERPYLDALGSRLREVRGKAGFAQETLSVAAGLSPWTYPRIERGQMRTRRSTLRRLVAVMLEAEPWLGDESELVEELVALAGPTLVPESPLVDRIERRRNRRSRAAGWLLDTAPPTTPRPTGCACPCRCCS